MAKRDTYSAVKGGAFLKQQRTAKGWRLSDISRLSVDILGEDNRLDEATLSMVERGRTQKPPLSVAARYAYVLQEPMARVVEAYGLPQIGDKESPAQHESIKKVISIADALSPLARERLYAQLEFAATMALNQAQGGDADFLHLTESDELGARRA